MVYFDFNLQELCAQKDVYAMDGINYQEFLKSKRFKYLSTGKIIEKVDIHPRLFEFQKDIVKWAVKKGRCAIFLDTGLGKTNCQLEWARLIGGTALIIAPLSVARQTIREAVKIGIMVNFAKSQDELILGINITNYEMIDHFTGDVTSIVLDESSILKSVSGKIKRKLIDTFSNVRYRLCCTATPAPNDYIEIGNHAWFLGVSTHQEMLSMFFINANKEHTFDCNGKLYTKKGSNKNGTEWRIKHHAEERFFEWMSSWAMFMMKPSDLSYDDTGYILPPLNIKPIIKEVIGYHQEDVLFFVGLKGISDRAGVRSDMVDIKLEMLKDLIHEPDDQWIVWCGLDKEAAAAKKIIGNYCREVKGSDSIESKVRDLEDFQDGKYPVLITKAKIAGHGMNFWNEVEYDYFVPGTRGYLFRITGIDQFRAPERVLKKLSGKAAPNSIVIPFEEEKVPDYYHIDLNEAISFAWDSRVRELLEPMWAQIDPKSKKEEFSTF